MVRRHIFANVVTLSILRARTACPDFSRASALESVRVFSSQSDDGSNQPAKRTRTARMSQWLSHSLGTSPEAGLTSGCAAPASTGVNAEQLTGARRGSMMCALPSQTDEELRSLVQEACRHPFSGAHQFQQAYVSLDVVGRRRLLEALVREAGVDWARAEVCMRSTLQLLGRLNQREQTDTDQFETDQDAQGTIPATLPPGGSRRVHGGGEHVPGDLMALERELLPALTPRYRSLIREINARPGGTKFLADMRGDVLAAISCTVPPSPGRVSNVPELRVLADALRDHLAVLLSPALLALRRVTWQDPAAFLEKIVAHEAVHPFQNLQDLKQRLGVGRRLFAYQHTALPSEPLVFIQVALTDHVPRRIQQLLRTPVNGREEDRCREQEATTAVFYSITSAQAGLRGIELGHFLIKRVVEQLRAELPNIQTFVTLSPVPGFLHWLLPRLRTEGWSASVTTDSANSSSTSTSASTSSGAPFMRHDPSHVAVNAGGGASRSGYDDSLHNCQRVQDASSNATGRLPGDAAIRTAERSPPPVSHLGILSEGNSPSNVDAARRGARTAREGDFRQHNERPLLSPEEQASILAVLGSSSGTDGPAGDGSYGPSSTHRAYDRLHAALARASWHADANTAACLEPVLLRLCCRYLVAEKKRGRALDPVANFHLSGGAELFQVNWMADTSAAALAQSAGMMVNYRYDLTKIEPNSLGYASDNKIVATPSLLEAAWQ